jgi:hypothetical protein
VSSPDRAQKKQIISLLAGPGTEAGAGTDGQIMCLLAGPSMEETIISFLAGQGTDARPGTAGQMISFLAGPGTETKPGCRNSLESKLENLDKHLGHFAFVLGPLNL